MTIYVNLCPFNTKVERFLFIKINIRSHYKRGLNNNSLVFGFYFYHSSFNNNTFGFTNLQQVFIR